MKCWSLLLFNNKSHFTVIIYAGSSSSKTHIALGCSRSKYLTDVTRTLFDTSYTYIISTSTEKKPFCKPSHASCSLFALPSCHPRRLVIAPDAGHAHQTCVERGKRSAAPIVLGHGHVTVMLNLLSYTYNIPIHASHTTHRHIQIQTVI